MFFRNLFVFALLFVSMSFSSNLIAKDQQPDVITPVETHFEYIEVGILVTQDFVFAHEKGDKEFRIPLYRPIDVESITIQAKDNLEVVAWRPVILGLPESADRIAELKLKAFDLKRRASNLGNKISGLIDDLVSLTNITEKLADETQITDADLVALEETVKKDVDGERKQISEILVGMDAQLSIVGKDILLVEFDIPIEGEHNFTISYGLLPDSALGDRK